MDEQKSIDAICKKIREQAQEEVESILKKTERNAKLRVKLAEGQAKKYICDKEEEAEKKAKEDYEKLLSNVAMQTREIIDRAKEELISLVFEKVREKGVDFRSDGEYFSWLRNLIVEGALSVAEADSGGDKDRHPAVKVVASRLDSKIFTDGFISGLGEEFKNKYGKEISIKMIFEQDLKDTGIRVESEDERIVFYNTFSDRTERKREQLRLIIYKEIFKDA